MIHNKRERETGRKTKRKTGKERRAEKKKIKRGKAVRKVKWQPTPEIADIVVKS